MPGVCRSTSPTPVPVPGTSPVVTVVLVNGRSVRCRIAETTPSRARSTSVNSSAPADEAVTAIPSVVSIDCGMRSPAAQTLIVESLAGWLWSPILMASVWLFMV